jgi:6-pyruvoyltetrahydropterin/6-carboxytetrahydropterin synthase
MNLTRLARRTGFQCLHRYAVEKWPEERNALEFGACFTPHGHGHNYELEAYFEGPVDKQTGMIMNLAEVDAILKQTVEPLDGKHLNLEVPEFKNQVPTTEALALYLTSRLREAMKSSPVRLAKVRLYECEDLWVDVWP